MEIQEGWLPLLRTETLDENKKQAVERDISSIKSMLVRDIQLSRSCLNSNELHVNLLYAVVASASDIAFERQVADIPKQKITIHLILNKSLQNQVITLQTKKTIQHFKTRL